MPDKKVSIKETPPQGGDENALSSEGEEATRPPPTLEEMWFDDPVEGLEAQRMALKLRNSVVLHAETNRIYLERSGIVALLIQGLHHLEKARPFDPAEWLAAFLLKNNPRRDMVYPTPNENSEPDDPLPQQQDAPPPVSDPIINKVAKEEKKKKKNMSKK